MVPETVGADETSWEKCVAQNDETRTDPGEVHSQGLHQLHYRQQILISHNTSSHGAVCMLASLESQALVFPFTIFNVCISFSNLPQSQNGHFRSHYPISGRGKMEEAKRKVYLPVK